MIQKIIRIGRNREHKYYSNSKESCAKKLFKLKRIMSLKIIPIQKNREPRNYSNSKEL